MAKTTRKSFAINVQISINLLESSDLAFHCDEVFAVDLLMFGGRVGDGPFELWQTERKFGTFSC